MGLSNSSTYPSDHVHAILYGQLLLPACHIATLRAAAAAAGVSQDRQDDGDLKSSAQRAKKHGQQTTRIRHHK